MRLKFAPHTVDRFTQTNSANTTFTSTITNGEIYKVYLNNSIQTVTTHYTINNGVVTFLSAPAVNSEIEIHALLVRRKACLKSRCSGLLSLEDRYSPAPTNKVINDDTKNAAQSLSSRI